MVLVKTHIRALILRLLLLLGALYIIFISPGYIFVNAEIYNLRILILLSILLWLFLIVKEIINTRSLILTGNTLEVRYLVGHSRNKKILLDDLISVRQPLRGLFDTEIIILGAKSGDKQQATKVIKGTMQGVIERDKENKEKSLLLRDVESTQSNIQEILNAVKNSTTKITISYAPRHDVKKAIMFLQPYVESNMKDIKHHGSDADPVT